MPKPLQQLYDELRVSRQPRGRFRVASARDDPFIVRLVELLLSYGIEARATDVHIEPTNSGARIRYRIDGILHEMLQLPQEISEPLIRSIKVKANMATDSVGRSKPQDGRIYFELNGCKLDLRLSSLPTLFGDVLAIRILNRSTTMISMEGLGFVSERLRLFERLIRGANGLILVTGPANSGKTTTLYAALEKLRSPSIKIVTLEDPVEYQMDGIDQAQINPAVGVSFASGLRAALRQDANIILVGEIRDTETAEIAIRAALTGHLVFSTLHTRHSCGAITRLLDMEIEPHLIIASITGVVAQRLVRLLCPACRAAHPEAARAFTRIWTQEAGGPPGFELSGLYKSQGCEACNQTGYRGRTGIFELLLLSDDLKKLILDRASAPLYRAAVATGMRTMLLDGLEKAAQGLTTIEEVLRVTGEGEEEKSA